MKHLLPKLLFRIVLPVLLLALTYAATDASLSQSRTFAVALKVFPYAVYFLVALLALIFNRSRALFALAILAASGEAVRLFPSGAADGSSDAPRIVFHAISILIPLNLIWIALVSERGFVTFRGLSRFGAIAVQIGAIALLSAMQPKWATAALEHRLIGTAVLQAAPMGSLALAGFVLAGIVLLARCVWVTAPIEIGLAWALAAALGGLCIDPLYFGAGGLLLAIALLATSHSLAFQDELTGLPARRAMNEALDSLGGTYAIAMLDIDHFKRVNDRYGHDVGDQVLKLVAARIRNVSGGGKPFRYGGEEFAVIFPGRKRADAKPYLETLRKSIQQSRFTVRSSNRPSKKPQKPKSQPSNGKKLSVTISIGVAGSNKQLASPDNVVQAADKALYRAKHAGRNRTSF